MTCMILCGGKSKRMGRAKEFLPLAGSTMLEHVLDRAVSMFSEVLLVTNKPEDFDHLSASIVKDIVTDKGPLVGVLSGLLISEHEEALALPCDMPLFDEQAIYSLINQHQTHSSFDSSIKATVYKGVGHVGSIPAIFNRTLVPHLEEALFTNQYSLSEFIERLPHGDAEGASNARIAAHFDINTPMDYIRLVHGQ